MSWTYQPERLAKFTKERPPKLLAKRAKQKAEDDYYDEQSAIAKDRDHFHCRICGAEGYIETHHVARRSSFGPKEMLRKHHHTNLLTVCAGPGRRAGKLSCYTQITGNVMKAVSTTAKGTNGPVLVTKFDAAEGGFVVFKKSA
jgi:hypothetical protein